MNKAEKYDMKQAYNKDLTKSARFNYLKNAMHDKKGMSMKDEGMMMMGQVNKGSMAMGRAGHVGSYTGNNMKLNATALMRESAGQERKNLLTDMPIDDRATPVANLNKGYGYQVGKPSVASRQKYGGNKGDESRSDRDYSAPTKMYGGKKGDMSKSRRDYM